MNYLLYHYLDLLNLCLDVIDYPFYLHWNLHLDYLIFEHLDLYYFWHLGMQLYEFLYDGWHLDYCFYLVLIRD